MLETIKSLADAARRTRHHAASLVTEADQNDRKIKALAAALSPEERVEYDTWLNSQKQPVQTGAAKPK